METILSNVWNVEDDNSINEKHIAIAHSILIG